MLKAIYGFEKDKLLKSSRLIVPLLILFAYIGIAYAIAPLNVLSSFSICSLVLFILMVSVGIMEDSAGYAMIEQTILVRLRRKSLFYLGKVVLMAAVSLVFAAIAILAPVLIDLTRGGTLFSRGLVAADVLSGFVLFWLMGLCGGITGLFAHHRIISNRKVAILLCIAFALLAVIKGAMNTQAEALKYVTWVLPPVHDISVAYSKSDYFQFGAMWGYFLWLAGYIGVEVLAYVAILRKRGVE